MALTSKVARGLCLSGPAARLLGPAAVAGGSHLKAPSASMHSRTSGLMEPLGKPWDYKKLGFNYYWMLLDGTTKRFRDNTKVIVVDGPPALGKTEFAKGLAEEFGMKFVPGTNMDHWYINSYGYDYRELEDAFSFIRNKPYDETHFARDPMGNDGGYDRMLWRLWMMAYFQYVNALAHLFNTGQGVVLERSPHSHWVYLDAALRQGWIPKSTRDHVMKVRAGMMRELLRPNMIIYLDAPVDVVQAKVRARAESTHPWQKNSPVYENTDYLDHLYNDLFKKQYLPLAAKSSYVLTYDWSEGGDAEVVVEDIEAMDMDNHEKYDKQQKDWRMFTEDNFATARNLYSGTQRQMLVRMMREHGFFHADNLYLSTEEATEQDKVLSRVPGNWFAHGYNKDLGDPEPMFAFLQGVNYKDSNVFNEASSLQTQPHNDPNIEFGDKVRAYFREKGDKDWWKKGPKSFPKTY